MGRVQPDNTEQPHAPETVHRAAYAFFDEMTRHLGDRLAESRFDRDGGLRLTVIDLADDDRAAIGTAAAALQVDGWVRVEAADPVDLASWERLRHDLISLAADRNALQVYPSPEPGYRRPPVTINLYAHAQSQAEKLHAAYGDFVDLRVGALPYPPSRGTEAVADAVESRDPADPAEMTVQLQTPLSIASGHHTTHTVTLTNHSDRDIAVDTNGNITADVINDDGTVIGGFVGPQRLPLITFTATPGGTVEIPLLVGTASKVASLGCAIPPGTWQLTAPLDLADGRALTSPPLTFTVTD